MSFAGIAMMVYAVSVNKAEAGAVNRILFSHGMDGNGDSKNILRHKHTRL